MGMGYIKKGSLSEILLTVLEKTIDGTVRFNDFINNPGLYAYHGGWEYPLDKSALSKAIVRLKEKGFIETNIDEKGLIFKLTDEGKQMLFLTEAEGKEWDGKYRIVIFDIPEQKKLVRNLFRRNLKKWGFKPLQKSVWISKKHITEKLLDYVKYLKLEDWVMVIESDKVGPRSIP
jgi:phenylacetic acid degradation operon negative regulatory protein